eukprot:5081231-Prymnesium_polylepis.1
MKLLPSLAWLNRQITREPVRCTWRSALERSTAFSAKRATTVIASPAVELAATNAVPPPVL